MKMPASTQVGTRKAQFGDADLERGVVPERQRHRFVGGQPVIDLDARQSRRRDRTVQAGSAPVRARSDAAGAL